MGQVRVDGRSHGAEVPSRQAGVEVENKRGSMAIESIQTLKGRVLGETRKQINR